MGRSRSYQSLVASAIAIPNPEAGPRMTARPFTRNVSHSGGFTLLEMLIVLTLIGILGSVVIPSVANRSKSFDVTEQARRIHTEVSKLRGRAVAERREFELSLSGGKTFTIKRTNDDGTKTTIRTNTLEGGGATLNGSNSGTLTFYPSGRVDALGDIRFFGSERTHKIRVLASGMTRWETE